MHKTITIAEGKRDFSGLLKEAEHKKEDIIVTRRGAPVGVIMSFQEYKKIKRIRSYVRMMELAGELKGRHVNISGLLVESRRELEDRSESGN